MGLGFLSTKASARVIKTVVRTKTIQKVTPPPPKEKVINNIITDSSEVKKIGSRMSELEDKVSKLASELQKYNDSHSSTPRTPIELDSLVPPAVVQPPVPPPVLRAPPPPPPPKIQEPPPQPSSVDLFLAELKQRVNERESRRVGDEIPSVIYRPNVNTDHTELEEVQGSEEPDEILVVSSHVSASKLDKCIESSNTNTVPMITHL